MRITLRTSILTIALAIVATIVKAVTGTSATAASMGTNGAAPMGSKGAASGSAKRLMRSGVLVAVIIALAVAFVVGVVVLSFDPDRFLIYAVGAAACLFFKEALPVIALASDLDA